MKRKLHIRYFILFSILIVTPLGFYSKFYDGIAASWVNNSLGGLFYVIFWCLVVFFIFPCGKPFFIALYVLLVTSFLEFLQLWQPPFLEVIRSTFLGRTLLGTSFVPSDFIYYVLGSILGWFWLSRLKSLSFMKKNSTDDD